MVTVDSRLKKDRKLPVLHRTLCSYVDLTEGIRNALSQNHAPPKGKMPSTGLTDTFLSYLPFDCQRHQTQKIQTKLIYIVLNPTHVESKRMDTPEIDATCDISTI